MPNEIDLSDLMLYAVQNKDGQFFRAKGYGGYGQTWVDSLKKVRLYTKIGPARATISFFANKYPEYGVPKLILFLVTDYQVVDETGRVEKQRGEKERRQAAQAERQREWELQAAQRRLEQAQAEVRKLGKPRA